jgi:hypothetical protein
MTEDDSTMKVLDRESVVDVGHELVACVLLNQGL